MDEVVLYNFNKKESEKTKADSLLVVSASWKELSYIDTIIYLSPRCVFCSCRGHAYSSLFSAA